MVIIIWVELRTTTLVAASALTEAPSQTCVGTTVPLAIFCGPTKLLPFSNNTVEVLWAIWATDAGLSVVRTGVTGWKVYLYARATTALPCGVTVTVTLAVLPIGSAKMVESNETVNP